MTVRSTTDRIEKQISLRATQSRVWRALTKSTEFGTWFGVRIEGEFAVGSRLKGQITIPGYEHCLFEVVVDRMDPEHSFSYRWHPYAVDPKVDYSKEPMTLVEFHLESTDGGTQLTVVESGFDKLPAARRAEAFRMNTGGWEGQLRNIERHVASR